MARRILYGLLILAAGFAIGGAVSYFLIKQGVVGARVNITESMPGFGGSQSDFSKVVSSVSPAVVNIATLRAAKKPSSFTEDPFYEFFDDFFSPFYDGSGGTEGKGEEPTHGSGVIVSRDGYIITNNHVISDAEQITVRLFDRRTFNAQIVGADPKTDIALIKISSDDLPVIPWADSDGLDVGEYVLAIGNPFGLSHTVTMGIVSAVGRADVGIAEYEDFIQTDAAINPGNSGGPLINTDGGLVGINTAIFTKSGGFQGIGFAVPSNMVRALIEQLARDGRVIRGWLGVTIQELTPELALKFGYSGSGALVGEVIGASPAETGGLKAGDIIFEYAGRAVNDPAALKNLVAQAKPGTIVPVRLFRDGKTISLEVVSGEAVSEKERPKISSEPKQKANGEGPFSGLGVMALTKDIARQMGIDAVSGGVVISRVEQGSPADKAGLRRGDVILEFDRRAVKTTEEFNEAALRASRADSALLYITRGGRKFFIILGTS